MRSAPADLWEMWLHDFNMWSEESEFGPETRSYPLKNKAKGEEFSLFLCAVPGAQVSVSSGWQSEQEVLLLPQHCVLLSWEEGGREK